MLNPGSYLDLEWLRSSEGAQVMSTLLRRDGRRLRQFGLLERPPLPPHLHMEEISYKVLLVGKTGVGKTSTVASLTGGEVPQTYNETPGLQTNVLHWPARIRQVGRTVLFKIHLLDAGETVLKRYDHILPDCQKGLDGIMFLFSYVDKGSFDEIQHLLNRLTSPNDGISKVVLGTKYDLHAHIEVTQRDIQDFENNWLIPVLKIRNLHTSHQWDTSGSGINEVACILNTICEYLWFRDISSHRNL